MADQAIEALAIRGSAARLSDLEADIARMRAVAQFCQQESSRVADPGFQAIAGLMHDYIGLCQDSLARGGDINLRDGITPAALPFRTRNLKDRLGRIFGPWFSFDISPAQEHAKLRA